ncbi:putative tetratricopeptide repeat domain containing protein [Monocercomonoides exilis]|uniref:putative tetratricopeptide repeat domain containing protein n=1 Tax=Monocercomonoides exilis TaxID=2049356 RepID=UPI003559CF91|nr:putative tetratricopeptide repeat domain containing protein [Monocercomonoides exilis]|eukprot:MONOS_12674.1-p1 / transcript=MONOS_12674.1 / gene=MONOS_12674 / organism=Monocercomonoides_exilis_PA203 / gene_product=tetratricopeptide repeat domain containing protein / transcript_product=tetratricopeptide repeat domain containing protein / location=Mono_scaffold00717:22827-24446(+) / protein_length=432 / sequence_SO=supercontig / SO=protein_coding / is_pseudo=false
MSQKVIKPAPANEILSTLPTSQALDNDDDWNIPEGWTIPDTVEKDLCPLFADSVPENIDEHPDFLALQSLLYDRDPAELAEHFKEEGNKLLKKGRKGWNEAIESYTKAIEANSPNMKAVAIYYSNRAQVHIFKKNYGRAIEDCIESLKKDNTNIKSHFRLSKAYFELNKISEASESVKKGLLVAPESKELLGLSEQIAEQQQKIKLRKEEAAKLAVEKHKIQTLTDKALELKGVKMGACVLHAIQTGCVDYIWFNNRANAKTQSFGPITPPTPHRNTLPELEAVVANPNSFELRTPFLVCYPEFSQTDLIQNVSEDDTIGDQLANLLPIGNDGEGEDDIDYPPWDRKHSYNLHNVHAFFRREWVPPAKKETVSEQKKEEKKKEDSKEMVWFEVPFEFTVGQLMQQEAYITPSFPVIYVLDATSPFTENFLT